MHTTALPNNHWIARTEALGPAVEQWRARAIRERSLPDELFTALRDAGMFRLSTPEALGGAEVDELSAVRVIEALSSQDGSVGWNVMVASNTATIASYLP